jgi:hypothetical protein
MHSKRLNLIKMAKKATNQDDAEPEVADEPEGDSEATEDTQDAQDGNDDETAQ